MNKNLFINTSFHNDVINMTYNELVGRIGEPTYGELSDDGKVQKEWNIITVDNVPFTIYDWKEYDRDVTDGDNVEWHIGHNGTNESRESIKKYLEKFEINIINNKMF